MAAASFFRSIYLSYFVKPQCERPLFRSLAKLKPQRIVEVGLEHGDRAMDLIELAQRHRPTVEIRYTGIDWFDAKPAGEPLQIKEAHRMLKSTGATVQLIPGEPISTLARVANNLTSSDVLILSSEVMTDEPDWYFVPRMLNDHSVVFVQREADGVFEKLSLKAVTALVNETSTERKAA